MDDSHFDAVTRHLARQSGRRALLGALAALPLTAGLLAPLAPDEAEAKERRRRRKGRHRKRKNKANSKRQRRKQRNQQRNQQRRKQQRKAEPSCTPEAASQTCAGTCGSVTNNCQQVVECAPCCTTPTTYLLPIDDLQAAIDAACDGETLTLSAGTWALPSPLQITRPLTLVGAGAGATTLSGKNEHRVVEIAGKVPVTLEALTITEGFAGSAGGGGIHTAGDLTLIDAHVFENDTEGDGGGIFNDGGTVTLESGSIVEANDSGWGAGVYTSKGTVTLKYGSTVTGNVASESGGGIASADGKVSVESGSTVEGNSAKFGGGFYLRAGTRPENVITLHAGSRVVTNTATLAGGAVYIYAGDAAVIVEPGAVICGNTNPQCAGLPVDGACPDEKECEP